MSRNNIIKRAKIRRCRPEYLLMQQLLGMGFVRQPRKKTRARVFTTISSLNASFGPPLADQRMEAILKGGFVQHMVVSRGES